MFSRYVLLMDRGAARSLSDSNKSLFTELCHSDPQYIVAQETTHKFTDPVLDDGTDDVTSQQQLQHPGSPTVRVGIHYPTLAVTSNTYSVCGDVSDDTVSIDSENGLESLKALYKGYSDPVPALVKPQIDAIKNGIATDTVATASSKHLSKKQKSQSKIPCRIKVTSHGSGAEQSSSVLCDEHDTNNNDSMLSDDEENQLLGTGGSDDKYVSVLTVSLGMSASPSSTSPLSDRHVDAVEVRIYIFQR